MGTLRLILCVQRWLRMNMHHWDETSWRAFALGELSTLNPRSYPANPDRIPAEDQVRAIQRVSHTSWTSMSSFARDLIWNIIALESTIECPSCAQTQLRVLQSRSTGAVVLECNQCDWSQYVDGSRSTETDCMPATLLAVKSLDANAKRLFLSGSVPEMPGEDSSQ